MTGNKERRKTFSRHFLKVIRKGLFKDWNVVRLMRI
jgi:hypothetical protein